MDDYERMGDAEHVWREYGDDDVLHWALCEDCRDNYVAPSSWMYCPACDGSGGEHNEHTIDLSLDRLKRANDYDLLAGVQTLAFLVMRYGLLEPCLHVSEGRRPAGFRERCNLCRNEVGEGAPVFVAETRRENLWEYGTEDLQWLLDQHSEYQFDEGRRQRREAAAEAERRANDLLPDGELPYWKENVGEFVDEKFEAEYYLLELREAKQPDANYIVVHPPGPYYDADDGPTVQHFFSRDLAWADYVRWNDDNLARFIVCDEVEMRRRLDDRIERRASEALEKIEATQLEAELRVSRVDAEADMEEWLQED